MSLRKTVKEQVLFNYKKINRFSWTLCWTQLTSYSMLLKYFNGTMSKFRFFVFDLMCITILDNRKSIIHSCPYMELRSIKLFHIRNKIIIIIIRQCRCTLVLCGRETISILTAYMHTTYSWWVPSLEGLSQVWS